MLLNNLKNWVEESYVKYRHNFTDLWRGFNQWYNDKYPSLRSDRDKIERIKMLPDTEKLVKSFQKIASQKTEYFITRIKTEVKSAHQRGYGYTLYNIDNEITRFVRQVWTNPTIQLKLWCGDESDKPSVDEPRRPISTLYINPTTYKQGYRLLGKSEMETMYLPSTSLQEVLKEYAIDSLGCCFYINPSLVITKPPSPEAKFLDSYVKNNFGRLLRIKNNPPLIGGIGYKPKGLFADIIEMLYTVRNSCVHGSFSDPKDRDDNTTLQAAYNFLYSLLSEFVS